VKSEQWTESTIHTALRAPISKVIDYLPNNIPRILINRTIVHPPEQHDEDDGSGSSDAYDFRDNYVFDAYLLGYCDDVTRALCKKLFANMEDGAPLDTEMEEGELLAEVMKARESAYNAADWMTVGVPKNRVFLFPGAEAPTGVTEEVAFREIAHCDGCAKQIKGIIQKCVVCFDYDLCQACFPLLSKTHYEGLHDFTAEAVAPAP
jgi:Zinc finger, ZZ type